MEEISICDPHALYLLGQSEVPSLPVMAVCPSAWPSSHFGIAFAKEFGGALILANAAASGAAPSQGVTLSKIPAPRCDLAW